MAGPEDAPRRATPANDAEAWLERLLFAARWLLAPIYLGLALSLIALIAIFAQDLYELAMAVVTAHAKPEKVIVAVLSLIDISLAGGLVMIVTLAGYENFVSKFDNEGHPDRPAWLGKVDFGGLKLKLIASIAAISAIQLLKIFMSEAELAPDRILWMLVIHITFVVSGVLLAVMDYITARTKTLGYPGD